MGKVNKMSDWSGGLPRPALTDVTNHTRKRPLEPCGGKLSDGMHASKQVCLGLDNSEENLALNKQVRKQSVESLNVAGEVESAAAVDDLHVNVGIVGGANAERHVIESDVVSRDSCCSVSLIPAGSDSCTGDSGCGLVFQENAVQTPKSGLLVETSLRRDCQNRDKDVPVADFYLDQSESSESAKSVKPGKVQSFQLERCTSLKGENDSDSAASAADMLKTCSCSFCLKAAYIWSDLHYQDIKGRISAVKKSKKEALNFFQRICIDKEANTDGQGMSDRTSKLESELSSQWRSLFLHMEESFSRESNHLQDNFLALKELRENCKVNLEVIDAKPADHD